MAEAAIPNVKSGAARRTRAVASASRGGWLAAAALLFGVLTVAAFVQPPHSEPARERELFSREWWLYPGEVNAAKQRLPKVEVDLNGVHAVEGDGPGRERIWAVGNLGLVIHSADGGNTWTKQMIPVPPPPRDTPDPQRRDPPPVTRITVPDVVNQQLVSARKTIEGLGLTSDVRYVDMVDRRLHGTVIDQKPAAGAQVAAGAVVTLMVKGDSAAVQQSAPDDPEQNKAPDVQDAPVGDPRQQYQLPQEQRRGETAKDDEASAWWRELAPGVVYAQEGTPSAAQTIVPPAQSGQVFEEDLLSVFAPNGRVRIAISRSRKPFLSVDALPWAYLDSESPPGVGEEHGLKFRRIRRSKPLRGDSWGVSGAAGRFVWFPNASGGLTTAQFAVQDFDYPDPQEIPPGSLRHLAADAISIDGQGIAWAVNGDGAALVYDYVADRAIPLRLAKPIRFRSIWIAPRGSDAPDDRLPPAWFVGEGGALIRVDPPDPDPARTETIRVTEGVSQPFDLRVETIPTGTQVNFNSITFLPDNRRGWIVGDRGTILRSDDGGKTWLHQTQGELAEATGEYERSLPPWYFASWLLVGLVLAPALRKEKPREIESESVADLLVSDRPLQLGDPDPMQLNAIAEGLSRFLRNENTEPPLTVAVTGKWGTGKSSLMNLLQGSLLDYNMRPVWFNAWHHQKDQHLLASLVQNIRLQAVPPWWHPQGWIFGARLFWIRDWRTWLPVGFLLASLGFLAGLFHNLADEPGSFNVLHIADIFEGLVNLIGGELNEEATAGQKGTLTLTLVGIVGSLYASYRKLLAFGVNPATLLAGRNGNAGLGGLEAQTGFRKRFADQFGEVTKALGPDRLVIFIDDLDRCQPDSVVEVLEAVNFLVSSGRCFIVLGMDSRYVERCVGLSFTEVAEEMVDEVEVDSKGEVQTLDAKRKRQEFAHNYLQKLINIEVPLPAPTAAQISELLTGPAESDNGVTRNRRWGWVPRLADVGRAALLVISALLIYQAVHLGTRTSWVTSHESSGSPGGSAESPGAGGMAAPAGAASGSLGVATNSNTPPPDATETQPLIVGHPGQRPEISMPGEQVGVQRWLGHWPALVVLFFLVAAGYWVLTRRPDLVVRDSPEFIEALRIWQPAVVARQNTPRAVKRFLNRVRYYAMRQRLPAPEMTLWHRVDSNLARLMGLAREEPPPAEAAGRIPEHALVALAAIAEYRGEVTLAPLAAIEQSDGVLPELLARHRQRYDAGEIDHYAAAFVTMAGGVEVR